MLLGRNKPSAELTALFTRRFAANAKTGPVGRVSWLVRAQKNAFLPSRDGPGDLCVTHISVNPCCERVYKMYSNGQFTSQHLVTHGFTSRLKKMWVTQRPGDRSHGSMLRRDRLYLAVSLGADGPGTGPTVRRAIKRCLFLKGGIGRATEVAPRTAVDDDGTDCSGSSDDDNALQQNSR